MNKYEAIMHAERINATLRSINNGDSAATDECALFISENTLDSLLVSAGAVVEYLLDSVEETDMDENEYIEIPLDSYEYIKNLTNKQKGAVLKNIYAYFFNSGNMECLEDDAVVKDATENMIVRIKEYAENGE